MATTTAPSRGIRHKGSLTKLGYREHEAPSKRYRALSRAAKKYGYKRIIDKLTDLQVLNKNRNPEFSRVVHADANWLRQHHRTPEPMRR
ncbi:MAG: hypothetical protein ACREBS_00415 [Nitrososphaerales archaeon]